VVGTPSGNASGSGASLTFPSHLLHHNLIAEAASKLPGITATAVAAVVSSTTTPYASAAQASSPGSNHNHNYSSPSPSNSIQSISSIGSRSVAGEEGLSLGSESPRVNVETETPSPSASPPLSAGSISPAPTLTTSSGSPQPRQTSLRSLSDATTPPSHASLMIRSSRMSNNNINNNNNNGEHKQASFTSGSPTPTTPTPPPPRPGGGGASCPTASSSNGFLELLLSPDKCQELIQYQVQHNTLLFPQQLLDSRLLSWEMLQETTARLLFMAVRWVKCLMPFQTLSKNDQHLLLQVRIIYF